VGCRKKKVGVQEAIALRDKTEKQNRRKIMGQKKPNQSK